MTYLAVGLSIAIFVLVSRLLRTDDTFRENLGIAHDIRARFLQPGLTDIMRENIARQGAISLLQVSFTGALKLGAALTASLLPSGLLVAFDLVDAANLRSVLLSPAMLAVAALAFALSFLRRS